MNLPLYILLYIESGILGVTDVLVVIICVHASMVYFHGFSNLYLWLRTCPVIIIFICDLIPMVLFTLKCNSCFLILFLWEFLINY